MKMTRNTIGFYRFSFLGRFGFGLAEVMIAMGLISVLALGFAQLITNLSKGVKTNRVFASRDDLRLVLGRLIGSPQALEKSASDAVRNSVLNTCTLARTNTCPGDNTTVRNMALLDSLGNVFVDSGGSTYNRDGVKCPSATANADCPLKVTVTFTANCGGPVPCNIAKAVTVTYLLRQEVPIKDVPFLKDKTLTITSAVPFQANSFGEINFLAKWASSTDLVKSDVFEDPLSLRLGIGTTTPRSKLEVNINDGNAPFVTLAGGVDGIGNGIKPALLFHNPAAAANNQNWYMGVGNPNPNKPNSTGALYFQAVNDNVFDPVGQTNIGGGYLVEFGRSGNQLSYVGIGNPVEAFFRQLRFALLETDGAYNPISKQNDLGIISVGPADLATGLPSTLNPPPGVVLAPWSTTSSGLRMTSKGYIGIGISEPLSRFVVDDSSGTSTGNRVASRIDAGVLFDTGWSTGLMIHGQMGATSPHASLLSISNSGPIGNPTRMVFADAGTNTTSGSVTSSMVGPTIAEGGWLSFSAHTGVGMVESMRIVGNSPSGGLGYVGIGTPDPRQLLDVRGAIRFGFTPTGGGLLAVTEPGTNYPAGKELVLTLRDGNGLPDDEVWIGPNVNGAVNMIRISMHNKQMDLIGGDLNIKSGNLNFGPGGGGTISSTSGLVKIANNLDVIGTIQALGDVWSQVMALSDVRLKEHIQPIENSLEKILQLQGVEYRLKSKPEKEAVGLIAQEVQRIFPQIVKSNPEGFLGIDYSKLVAPIIEAIKQVYKKLTEVLEKVFQMQTELERLKNQNLELQDKINQLILHQEKLTNDCAIGANGLRRAAK